MIDTPRLQLVLQSPAEALAWVEALPPDVQAQVSPIWLERVRSLTMPDPWACMFTMRTREDDQSIGSCGYKGPPDATGVVEIAYGVDEASQSQGYATEAVSGLIAFARSTGQVQVVRAHTLIGTNASTRVLAKNGFELIGEVIDPEDGLVNRWEYALSEHVR